MIQAVWQVITVSTHSRPKAAGEVDLWLNMACKCFNTQPPEGGWKKKLKQKQKRPEFQHTAARRRLEALRDKIALIDGFQHTAARRRLVLLPLKLCPMAKFQHTAARRRLENAGKGHDHAYCVSTHSRPKAAGASLKSLVPSGFAAPISLSS